MELRKPGRNPGMRGNRAIVERKQILRMSLALPGTKVSAIARGDLDGRGSDEGTKIRGVMETPGRKKTRTKKDRFEG